MLRNSERRRVHPTIDNQQMTKQSHKAECDINNILSQFKKTGIINHITQQQPTYTDLPDNLDYQNSLHLLQTAEDAFATLPSVVRRYFDNDPGEFLAAFSNPAMEDKLREFGLLDPKPAPQPAGNPDNNVVDPASNPPKL